MRAGPQREGQGSRVASVRLARRAYPSRSASATRFAGTSKMPMRPSPRPHIAARTRPSRPHAMASTGTPACRKGSASWAGVWPPPSHCFEPRLL